MDLYIFDRNLNFIGILDTFTSLQWNRRYYKMGDFELQCPLNLDNLSLLAKGNIIWKQGDNEAGYIIYRDLKQDDTGQETLDIKGNLITGYLKQRIIWNMVNITDTVENIMRTLVNQNCINSTDSKRIIPNLSLGTLKNLTYSTNYQQNKNANLNDEIEALSALSNLGHRILFDPQGKQLTFDIYAGVDRTVHQSVVSPCIFSKEFENVLGQEYTDSDDNLKSVCLVNGNFTNPDNTQIPVSTTVGNSEGLDRYEMSLDSNSSSKIDTGSKDSTGKEIETYLSESDFLNVLINDGNTELAQYTEAQTFDSTINININLTYKTDFDLGDIVTCLSRKWGITIDTRITEVQEVYEEQGFGVSITFGNAVPTLIDKIKQKLR